MRDIDGKEVCVGDVVRVLHIRENIREVLAEDEKQHTLGMLDKDFEIDEFVNDNTQISLSYSVSQVKGCIYGGLYLYPEEFRLIKRREPKR